MARYSSARVFFFFAFFAFFTFVAFVAAFVAVFGAFPRVFMRSEGADKGKGKGGGGEREEGIGGWPPQKCPKPRT